MLAPVRKAKKCRHCRAEFTPVRPLQVACGVECAKVIGQKVAAKKAAEQAHRERSADRAKLESMKRLPQLIAAAQDAFNKFIRTRDRDQVCFVCERPFDQNIPGRAMHAGHVRSRGAAGHLRFNEDNCHGECEGCNGPHGAKPHEIEAGAIRRIGQERYDALKNDNTPKKWLKDEVRAIKAIYSAKRRALLKQGETV
jgi:hypothetical protein